MRKKHLLIITGMDRHYVIIGAGLAGSAAAYLLAKTGRKVTLIERADAQAKSKLCGGLMTPRSMALASKIYGQETVEPLYKRSFNQMLCITDKNETMLSGVELKSLMRKDLDDMALGSFLRYGGRLIDKCSVKAIDLDSKRLELSERDCDAAEIGFDVLIAADGALSSTREKLLGRAPRAVLSLETQIDAIKGLPLTMSYSPSLKGYCWYIPQSASNANIGCVGYRGDGDLDAQLETFAASLGASYRTRRGAFIPAGDDICLKQDGVFYIGDASGLICPPTGEGIYYALLTAEALFEAIAYNKSYPEMLKPHVREIARQYRLRNTFYSKSFIDKALDAASKTPYGTERAVRFALRHFAGF